MTQVLGILRLDQSNSGPGPRSFRSRSVAPFWTVVKRARATLLTALVCNLVWASHGFAQSLSIDEGVEISAIYGANRAFLSPSLRHSHSGWIWVV